ncbi:hypothetical protein O181_014975 [Austropuccinia psidii MF-1]|uniref:hAT-like transposase RNase-H fold domain-containing protein n=1 Tax=Austropuccinia psidii MF-1 TaxID=1389203 RepID=A0A9Q3C2Y6_9BASI|nr:hypothetical protein [Austropuccinia psidii MF-1]
MAHTIHLASQDGLKALSIGSPNSTQNTSKGEVSQISIANLIDIPDGQDIQYNSIILQISRLEGFLNQSLQQREKFNTTVKLIYNDYKPTKATNLLLHVCTRWNSTYEMLVRALILEEAYSQFFSLPNMQSYQLNALKWGKVKIMIDFLEPLYKATQIICGSKYQTISHALPLYILLIRRIEQACHQYNVTPIEPSAKEMCKKLTKYVKILITKIPAICATILDPQFKINFFYTNEATLASLGTSATTLSIMLQEEAQKHFKQSISPKVDLTAQQHVGLFDEMYSTLAEEVSNLETEVE